MVAAALTAQLEARDFTGVVGLVHDVAAELGAVIAVGEVDRLAVPERLAVPALTRPAPRPCRRRSTERCPGLHAACVRSRALEHSSRTRRAPSRQASRCSIACGNNDV